jgi:hypothetical protein
MDQPPFTYQPRCSFPGSKEYAIYKIAAPWSYGNMRELKTYALCREEHLEAELARARAAAAKISPSDGEVYGEVGVYQLLPGLRDADLSRVK